VSEPILTTKLPPGWMRSDLSVLEHEVLAHGVPEARPDLGVIILAGLLLSDGTNLYSLVWSTGQRVARTTADTGWAIEEQFDGQQPTSDDDPRAVMWRIAIDCMVGAAQKTRLELGQ